MANIAATWVQHGAKNRLSRPLKNMFLRVWEPRWAKIAPRALQEAPKSPPRAAQEPPRALQEPLGTDFSSIFDRFVDDS